MDTRLSAWYRAFEPELRALWSARRAFDKSSKELGHLLDHADAPALLRLKIFGESVGNKELELGAAQLLQVLEGAIEENTRALSAMDASWASARVAVLALTVCFERLSFSSAAQCLDDDDAKSFEDYRDSVMANLDRVVGAEVK